MSNVFCCSNLKEQWKFSRGDLLQNSVIRHGRALLNYQADESEENDLDKPLVFGPVNQLQDRQPVAKATDPDMLNASQRKTSTFKSRSVERKDLMVIKNKWDFLSDSKHKRRNSKRKERNSKSRRKVGSKQQNTTLDEQFYCPSSFNKTEVNR